MLPRKSASIIIVSLVFAIPIPMQARPVPMQTYKELADTADVIVIADASRPSDVAHTGGLPSDLYQQVETTLRVHLVLKGDLGDAESLTFVHFRVKSAKALGVLGGPRLLKFDPEGKYWQFTFDQGRGDGKRTHKAKYLVFLRIRPDGKYEAVTGQSDPVESVKLLMAPEAYAENSFLEDRETRLQVQSAE